SALLANVLPPMVMAVLFILITMYYTIVMFSMIGYTIYQYHEELGFSIDVDYEETDEGKSKLAQQDENPVLAQLNRLIVDGKNSEAVAYMKDAIAREPMNVELLDRYYKLLKLENNPSLILEAGENYIPKLVQLGRLNTALDLFQDCIRQNKQFALKDPEALSAMAKNAKLLGHPKLVINLLNGFAKRFPKRHDIPELYLLVAKALSEEYKQDAKAKQLLEDLISKYPDHPAIPEIRNFNDIVTNLMASQTA
ncbi:MAG: tetratricopeptide repeat protein, partial [Thioalkalispiraceae bacterium]